MYYWSKICYGFKMELDKANELMVYIDQNSKTILENNIAYD